jgi:hypothetical protein
MSDLWLQEVLQHMSSALEQWDEVSTNRTVDVVQDLVETLVLPNLLDDFRYRVWG